MCHAQILHRLGFVGKDRFKPPVIYAGQGDFKALQCLREVRLQPK